MQVQYQQDETHITKKSTFHATFSCFCGSVLEWYDFAIFAYLEVYLSPLFFVQSDKFVSMIMAYTVFAVGFLIRPLGALLFGHISDRYGRKITMLLTITLMTLPTFSIGLLPTYQTIGVWAPILILVLRLLQGISAGGEIMTAAVFALESANKNRWGFIGALIRMGSGAGLMMGSLVVTVLLCFISDKQMSQWGWRLPFLFSIITGMAAIYLRQKTKESLAFLQLKNSDQLVRHPIVAAWYSHKICMLKIAGLYGLCAVINYLSFVYMPSYSKFLKYNHHQATTINTIAMSIELLLMPVMGIIADRVGYRKLLFVSAYSFILLSAPIYYFIAQGNIMNLLIGQTCIAVIGAIYHGSVTALALRLIPSRVRTTVAGFGYNISYSILGGISPLLATYLIMKTNNLMIPSYFLFIAAVISLITLHSIDGEK